VWTRPFQDTFCPEGEKYDQDANPAGFVAGPCNSDGAGTVSAEMRASGNIAQARGINADW